MMGQSVFWSGFYALLENVSVCCKYSENPFRMFWKTATWFRNSPKTHFACTDQPFNIVQQEDSS